MNRADKIGLIADDFTGAMDTGAQFASYGFETSFALSSIPASQVVVLNTASREIQPHEARARCLKAVHQLQGRRLFKKIDSILRGHIAAELEGMVSASIHSRIVVCPTSPHQGHLVRNGTLFVHDTPVHESIFNLDPAFPAHTSLVAELLGFPSTHIGLETVRSSVQVLANAISTAPTAVVTVDAINTEDLLQISQVILMNDFFPCGASGLANAWAQTLAGGNHVRKQTANPDLDGPLMIVAGSANLKTHEQISALARHPESLIWKINVPITRDEKEKWFEKVQAAWRDLRVLVMCPGRQSTVRDPEWLIFHQTVSCLAVELLEHIRPSSVLITGGETANYLCGMLDVQAVRLIGEALRGIPFGKVIGGQVDNTTLLTKAGGNGREDCLEKVVYA